MIGARLFAVRVSKLGILIVWNLLTGKRLRSWGMMGFTRMIRMSKETSGASMIKNMDFKVRDKVVLSISSRCPSGLRLGGTLKVGIVVWWVQDHRGIQQGSMGIMGLRGGVGRMPGSLGMTARWSLGGIWGTSPGVIKGPGIIMVEGRKDTNWLV